MRFMIGKKNYYKYNKITSYFGENREFMKIKNYYWHEGIDFSGMKGTKLNIINVFSGIIKRESYNKYYGNYVEIKHNPIFIGGEDESFFSRYSHLNKIEKNLPTGFIEYGKKLGIMGNTGNSFGVHLHWDIRQKEVKENHKTNLLIAMQEKIGFEDNEFNFNWQFGNLYINPLLMMEYFKKLQEEI